MDSNIDESITKIYEKQQTVSGSEEEAMQYLTILKRHPELNVTFEENESNIKLPLKSWNKIIKKIPEEESYSLTYICFSLINEVDENEIWGIKKTKESDEAEVFQDVFFNTVLEASIPHEIPFAMCEEDFSQFTDYFNQKEANERNIKLSNEDWINKEKENEKPLDKQDTEINKDKDLDEDKNVKEVKKQIIEDKNGVKKLITTKTVTQSQTIYKRKIQPQPQTKIQKDKEKEKDKVISIPSKPEQKVELIKKQDVIPKKEEKIKVPEQKVEQIKQQEVVPKKEEKIIIPEKELEEIIYRIEKPGRFRPVKIYKKIKDPKGKEKEDEITNEEIIYETDENQPNLRIIRKKIILRNGKEEEIEEEPKKKVVYKIIKTGHAPIFKIIRIVTIVPKYGKERDIEEDLPGNELIVKTIKQGPNKYIKQIIIKKDGKILEIDEERPLAEEAQGIKKEEQPENKIIRKKIIARDISTQPQETKEEKIIIKKEEEPQTKILRKKIISKDIKLEESPKNSPKDKNPQQ